MKMTSPNSQNNAFYTVVLYWQSIYAKGSAIEQYWEEL